MKKETLPNWSSDGNAKAAMPVAIAVLGASLALMAIMLLSGNKKPSRDNGNHEVENYDVVGNMPYIFWAS